MIACEMIISRGVSAIGNYLSKISYLLMIQRPILFTFFCSEVTFYVGIGIFTVF